MITGHLHWNFRRILIQHTQAYLFPLFHLVISDSGPKILENILYVKRFAEKRTAICKLNG